MSSYNPYDQSGFSEGFGRGFGLALDQQKQTLEAKKAAQEQAYQQQSLGLAQQRETREAGLTQAQIADMNEQQKIRETQALRDTAKFNAESPHYAEMAQLGVQKAQTDIAAEQARKAAMLATAGEANAKTQQTQAENRRDAELEHAGDAMSWINGLPDDAGDLNRFAATGRNLDAFMRVGIKNGQTPDKFGLDQGSVNQFNNIVFHRELAQDNGKQLTPADIDFAKKSGATVAPGATIIGRTWTNQQFNPGNNNALIPMTQVQVKNKDGTFSTFQEPWTDSETGLVKQIPMDQYTQRVQGAGHLYDGMQQYMQNTGEPMTKQNLQQIVGSHINSLKSVNPNKYYKVDRMGDLVDPGTQTITPNTARPAINPQQAATAKIRDRYTQAITKAQSLPGYDPSAIQGLKTSYQQETGEPFDLGAAQTPTLGNPSQLTGASGGTSANPYDQWAPPKQGQ